MASLVDGGTTAVCITNANNPTATVLSSSAVAAFVGSLPAHVTVVIDEAYHEYVHDAAYGSAMALVQQGRNVVVVRTFSKVYGLAGIRVGYAVGPSSRISQMSAWHLFATVSRPALDGARAALGDGQHIADTVALNDEAKGYAFTSFGTMGLACIPSETNFFMVDVGMSASVVAAELAARGILVRTGWGMPQHLRISTGTMPEMVDLVTALQEILGAVAGPEDVTAAVTALHGNFPNPVRETTRIVYSLRTDIPSRLEIFNIRGQLARTEMLRGHRGYHAFEWDGRDQRGERVAAGSYFYRLSAGDVTQTRRLIVIW